MILFFQIVQSGEVKMSATLFLSIMCALGLWYAAWLYLSIVLEGHGRPAYTWFKYLKEIWFVGSSWRNKLWFLGFTLAPIAVGTCVGWFAVDVYQAIFR